MGLFKKMGEALQKIDYHISSDPETVGRRFEDHVQKLFTPKYFVLKEKTHSYDTNRVQYVESSLNPDFVWKYKPTDEQFAIECKYRTGASFDNQDRLTIATQEQLNRYRVFSQQRKIPVFLVIGLGLEVEDFMGNETGVEKFMACIPLSELKYTAIFESVFTRYERPFDKPFFWKNGVLK